MVTYYLITFNNTHEAMDGEVFLKSKNINSIMMPTPTYITKSCGLSLRIKKEDIYEVKIFILQGEMKIKGLYGKYETEYKEIIL